MTAKLIAVQLETCHHNKDATAWYAYYEGELDTEALTGDDALAEEWKKEVREAAKKDGAPLGLQFEDSGQDEVPSPLSEAAGLYRYLVALAV